MSQRAPFPLRHFRSHMLKFKQSGFTLLELIIVVSILAIIGGIVLRVVSADTLTNAQRDANLGTLGQVRDALLQFRQDMGYFPGQGPLNGANLDLTLSGFDVSAFLESAGGTAAVWANLGNNNNMFNFWQLFRQPYVAGDTPDDDDDSNDRWSWNSDLGLGWNGPYLGGYGLRYQEYEQDSETYNNIYALSDRFDATWEIAAENGYWTTGDDPAEAALARAGQPLRLMCLTGVDYVYYIVSAGPNGVMDTDPDNPTHTELQEDDVGMALGR